MLALGFLTLQREAETVSLFLIQVPTCYNPPVPLSQRCLNPAALGFRFHLVPRAFQPPSDLFLDPGVI